MQMQKDKVFTNLVRNAFDFLDESIEQFEVSPKYSVINFHSAVELFFKARLLREHWSLIIVDPKSANRENFKKGNFQSVGISAANDRLKDIVSDGVGDPEINCFKNLTNHRNQMVHFFHEGLKKEEEQQVVISELCKAWYYLHKVLSTQWANHFNESERQLRRIETRMAKHRQFLKGKFELVKGDLKSAKESGLTILTCPSCKLKSSTVDLSGSPVFERNCLVCSLKDSGVRVACPDCEKKQLVAYDFHSKCVSKDCEHEFDGENIAEILEYDPSIPGDEPVPSRANCGECDGHETIVRLNQEKWLCISCGTKSDTSDLEFCEWCSEPGFSLPEATGLDGCPSCPGNENLRDD